MSRVPLFALGAFVVLLSPIATSATTALPDAIDLKTLLALVRDRSPALAAQREDVSLALAERMSSGAYPNPSLELGAFKAGPGGATLFDGERQQEMTIAIPLLVMGQWGARMRAADQQLQAAESRFELQRMGLEAEAALSFVGLLAAQERVGGFEEASADLERVRGIVDARASIGLASQYDVTRIAVEFARLAAVGAAAQAEVVQRAGQLTSLLEQNQWRPRALGSLEPLQSLEFVAALENAAEGAQPPSVRLASLEEAAAEAGVELARRERWPVPALALGRVATAAPFGAAGYVGLSLDLPLFDRRRGSVARSEAELRAAGLRLRAATAKARAELASLSVMLQTQRAALERFDREAGARLPALRQMAEDAYRLNRGSILELLDALRARHDLELERIELARTLKETEIRLLSSSGHLHLLVP